MPPRQMRKEFVKGKRGGAKWGLWVIQLICELLVLGVPPSTIPSAINTFYKALYKEPPNQVPCVRFIRQCHVVVQVMAETMAAIKLGNADTWVQLSNDATSRRQLSFQCLIISILAADGKIDPVIVSSCIYMDDETAETTVDSLCNKVSKHQFLSTLFLLRHTKYFYSVTPNLTLNILSVCNFR
jgi:hypothetical protein